MNRRRGLTVAFVSALLLTLLISSSLGQAGSAAAERVIRGGGTTMVEGGTGPPSFTPMITKFSFHARSGEGAFECLALAPSEPAGSPGSGEYDTNVMYVTGPVTSANVTGNVATLEGTATVTGAGAGSDEPYTLRVTRGGPGATLVLDISGLTFREIVIEGQISF